MKKLYIALLISSLLLPTVTINAESFPKLKSGLWQIESAIPGMPTAMKIHFCIDEATQDKLFNSSADTLKSSCEPSEVKKEGASFLVDKKCNFAGKPFETHAKITFSSETSYVNEITTVSPRGNRTISSTGTYVGACESGQKPGDMKIDGTNTQFNIARTK